MTAQFDFANAVKERATTTGTDAFGLDGSSIPNLHFGMSASLVDGQQYYYEANDGWAGGTSKECGYGTWDATAKTLSRDTILRSTNSDAIVNFSTTPYVQIDIAAEWFNALELNFDGNGKIGIGGTPTSRVTIFGTAAAGGDIQIGFNWGDSDNRAGLLISRPDATGSQVRLVRNGATHGGTRLGVSENNAAMLYTDGAGANEASLFAIGTSGLIDLVLSAGNAEAMRVDGNDQSITTQALFHPATCLVGGGTAILGAGVLEISGTNITNQIGIVTNNDASIARGGLVWRTSQGTQRGGIRSGIFKADNDLEFLTGAHALAMILSSTKRLGVNVSTPLAQIHADQSSTTAAIPVMILDQGDSDETFMEFVGASAADDSASLSTDSTEDDAKAGAIKIETSDGVGWLRYYSGPS